MAVEGETEFASDGEQHAGLVEVSVLIVGDPGHACELAGGVRAENPGWCEETFVGGKGFQKIHVTHGKL